MMQLTRTAFVALGLLLCALLPSAAQAQSIVRDAEIEALLRDYAAPLFKAAGVRGDRVDIILINDRSFNAFVSGNRIFFHTGAIVDAETPNEIIGVMAHEIGHLAGGHQERLRQEIDRAQAIAAISSVIGMGAAAAAGASGNGAGVSAGAGIAAGGTEAAMRGLLAYRRTEEQAADRSAITYLDRTGQSAAGMLATFKRFDDGLSLVRNRINPYKISHPLPRDRIQAMEALAKASPHFNKKDSPALQLRHDMARGKIIAYTDGPAAAEQFARKVGGKAGDYARAIATFLNRNPRAGIEQINRLIGSEPSNPYFHEMLGEAKLVARDADGAVAAFSKAVQLSKGRHPTMQVALGHALVLKGDEQSLRRAVGELEVAISIDPVNPRAYQHLAMAYGRLNDPANAELATAEAYFHAGNYREAKRFAARAQSRFRPSEPQWLRADDIQKFRIPRSAGR